MILCYMGCNICVLHMWMTLYIGGVRKCIKDIDIVLGSLKMAGLTAKPSRKNE